MTYRAVQGKNIVHLRRADIECTDAAVPKHLTVIELPSPVLLKYPRISSPWNVNKNNGETPQEIFGSDCHATDIHDARFALCLERRFIDLSEEKAFLADFVDGGDNRVVSRK